MGPQTGVTSPHPMIRNMRKPTDSGDAQGGQFVKPDQIGSIRLQIHMVDAKWGHSIPGSPSAKYLKSLRLLFIKTVSQPCPRPLSRGLFFLPSRWFASPQLSCISCPFLPDRTGSKKTQYDDPHITSPTPNIPQLTPPLGECYFTLDDCHLRIPWKNLRVDCKELLLSEVNTAHLLCPKVPAERGNAWGRSLVPRQFGLINCNLALLQGKQKPLRILGR